MKKLEVYLTGGFIIPVEDSFEEVLAILDRKTVAPGEYMVLSLEDGFRTALRRRDIIGIGEYSENER